MEGLESCRERGDPACEECGISFSKKSAQCVPPATTDSPIFSVERAFFLSLNRFLLILSNQFICPFVQVKFCCDQVDVHVWEAGKGNLLQVFFAPLIRVLQYNCFCLIE
ncbi:hypothetical protein COLO4_37608 [Corchorus olitorius]|uniref:Uncharacterized protein n=1 Tax=Corchorus olitorius TaxID=93759 RepID=A0A1R3G0I7_9ROSI|nr:hypothetical protein COLO4_37608 [Corchorus olitorius]